MGIAVAGILMPRPETDGGGDRVSKVSEVALEGILLLEALGKRKTDFHEELWDLCGVVGERRKPRSEGVLREEEAMEGSSSKEKLANSGMSHNQLHKPSSSNSMAMCCNVQATALMVNSVLSLSLESLDVPWHLSPGTRWVQK